MTRIDSLVRTGALTIIAALAAFLLSPSSKPQLVAAAYVPFTAHLVEDHFANAAASASASIQYITVERKADGSEATLIAVNSPDMQTGSLDDILDVPSHTHVTVESFTKSTMTFYLSGSQLNNELARRHCPADVNALTQHSTILGYDIVRYHVQYGPYPPRTRYDTDDKWMALAFACFALKEISGASSGAWNRTTVVSLTEDEPAASLFAVPAGYIERTPAQLAAKWARMFPGSDWMPADSLQRLQRNYNSHRASH
jgi:hypothetical protein